jgi:hypothetical protein
MRLKYVAISAGDTIDHNAELWLDFVALLVTETSEAAW